MQTTTIDTTHYYVRLVDPLAAEGGEMEPWGPAATARVRAAAENIGLETKAGDEQIDIDEIDNEIDWADHAWGKGRRYNVRQWEMWLRRQIMN